MSVSKGTPLVVLSSKNMADGDPVQKARIAYEVSKRIRAYESACRQQNRI